jgi:N-acetylmuramic acid 6-phosphate etherase
LYDKQVVQVKVYKAPCGFGMAFQKITESESAYKHLEKMSVQELLSNINKEDATIATAVAKVVPLDASECPPTYGVPYGLVIGIIAGGKKAITEAVEFAEDDMQQGWIDLQEYKVNANDVVIGIAASGTTPYVIGALEKCRENNIITGSICCNPDAPISSAADYAIEAVVGPEFVTGSTRMKSGTAQKIVLNMISTSVMIQLGRVEDNKMVNMQLTNEKLVDRGVKMLMEKLGLNDYETAKELLLQKGSVKKVIESFRS